MPDNMMAAKLFWLFRWLPMNAVITLIAFILLGALPVRAERMLVSAAVSLRGPMCTLGSMYEHAHPGSKINFNFASSGELVLQIERGAPVDVIVSASRQEMARLVKDRLVSRESISDLAGNTLVAVVPSGCKPVTTLKALASLSRVAVGNPLTVPAGAYAANALSRAGVYQELVRSKKLVLAESARQVLTYVTSANVDAGLVYATDLRAAPAAMPCFAIPVEMTGPIVYPAAAILTSEHKSAAASFISFLMSPAAQKVFASDGFIRVAK